MLDTKRELFKGLEKIVGKIFFHDRANAKSIHLNVNYFCDRRSVFHFKAKLLGGAGVFVLAAFMDFVDGAVARYKNMSTVRGAYLDTVVDRYVEGLIFIGMMSLPFEQILIPGYLWVFLAMFGSVLTTYSKAAAKEKNVVAKEAKGGLLSRGERLILMGIALVLASFNLTWTLYIIIALAVLSNFTAIQRVLSVWNVSAKNAQPEIK